ncbi:TPA: helix-turn-helix transcriptional regulator [Vibrio cholerae]|nr:helix-turn-helix transcriptional regulator [Vibrio cholerae]EJL6528278.1 helix-turn-helix transcriptional regulator [Vibrio cholerae]EJL6845244.1 helix-turn-helix transcriptional regulator [Vibrio cholerae]MCX9511249.1 helix-turn-helix transcriptional regulator [Vibrio cholerae]HAS7158281.1 transcriptional regulator [Vibrio cholerae]
MEMDEMKKNAEEVAELLRVMAHPERLMVLCQLTQSEMGVGQLQQGSTLSQSAFSQHLTVLRKHGIIQARKESQQVFYRLADSRITALIQSLQNVFCR